MVASALADSTRGSNRGWAQAVAAQKAKRGEALETHRRVCERASSWTRDTIGEMESDPSQGGLLTTIGYGDRPWNEFLDRLRAHRIRYLIDVRSQPRSRQPEFNGDALRVLLGQAGITYVFMGDALGGKPDDPSCYVDGKVDYARCQARPVFSVGLERLMTALKGGHRVALMCSELDPERCHRSKLIGEALQRRNVPLLHIDRDGAEVTQQTVIGRLTGGQSALFGESFTSRGRYAPPSQEED